ncbi:MAG TPA: DUF1295 domain-containing protein [Candidatus Saccharimonadales bacterium]
MLKLLAVLAAGVWVYMTAWFAVARVVGRNDVADIAWGLGFAVVAWLAFLVAPQNDIRAAIINLLVTIWALRLAYHIYRRNAKKPEDTRYQDMRKQWGSHPYLYAYVKVFLAQGFLLLLIALPVAFANQYPGGFMWWHGVGLAVWALGFFFEAVGDYQLSQFIKNPANKGKLMTSGLWRYTRHPNYFGEVTQWWGIFLMALVGGWTWLAVIGPITITLLILKVSGIPLLEKKMQQNPGFKQYASTTSKFLPLPPRK